MDFFPESESCAAEHGGPLRHGGSSVLNELDLNSEAFELPTGQGYHDFKFMESVAHTSNAQVSGGRRGDGPPRSAAGVDMDFFPESESSAAGHGGPLRHGGFDVLNGLDLNSEAFELPTGQGYHDFNFMESVSHTSNAQASGGRRDDGPSQSAANAGCGGKRRALSSGDGAALPVKPRRNPQTLGSASRGTRGYRRGNSGRPPWAPSSTQAPRAAGGGIPASSETPWATSFTNAAGSEVPADSGTLFPSAQGGGISQTNATRTTLFTSGAGRAGSVIPEASSTSCNMTLFTSGAGGWIPEGTGTARAMAFTSAPRCHFAAVGGTPVKDMFANASDSIGASPLFDFPEDATEDMDENDEGFIDEEECTEGDQEDVPEDREEKDDLQEQEQPDATENDLCSPMSTSRKRGSASTTSTTARSPDQPEKSKTLVGQSISTYCSQSSMQYERGSQLLEEVLNRKFELMNKVAEHKINYKKFKQQMLAKSIKTAEQLAIECGVNPKSSEWYCVGQICKDPVEREFFISMPNPESRLSYLEHYLKNHNLKGTSDSDDSSSSSEDWEWLCDDDFDDLVDVANLEDEEQRHTIDNLHILDLCRKVLSS